MYVFGSFAQHFDEGVGHPPDDFGLLLSRHPAGDLHVDVRHSYSLHWLPSRPSLTASFRQVVTNEEISQIIHLPRVGKHLVNGLLDVIDLLSGL